MDTKKQMKFSSPIGGVHVEFPCKPYASQLQMMSKIIKALNENQNALLESPTGTGKSLALLCSTLAWIKSHNETSTATTVCSCLCNNETINSSIPTLPVLSALTNSAMINNSPLPTVTMTTSHMTSTPSVDIDNNSLLVQNVPGVTQQPPILPGVTQQPPILPGVTQQPPILPGVTQQPPILPLISGVTQQPPVIPSVAHQSILTQLPPVVIPIQTADVNIGNVFNSVQLNESILNQLKIESSKTTRKRPLRNNDNNDDFKPTKTKKRQSLKRKQIAYDDDTPSTRNATPTTIIKDTPTTVVHHNWEMKVDKHVDDVTVNIYTEQYATPTINNVPNKVCGCSKDTQPDPRDKRIKKIFYGTRTHKQIKQITHELARTAYSSMPMTILGSREHTCIHPDVSQSKNKNEDCKKLLDYAEGVTCSYFHKVQQSLNCQSRLREYTGFNDAWDIEDLVKLGKKIKVCPYFATRAVLGEAVIIFCPYNYLIDPKIRKQMFINLEDHIVILDEAHNMEDVSRSAASLDITIVQLCEIRDELVNLVKVKSENSDSYEMILMVVNNVINWMETESKSLKQERHEESYGIWTGHDYILTLKKFGITEYTNATIMQHLNRLFENAMESRENTRGGVFPMVTLSMGAITVLEGFFDVIGYLYNYKNDYRVALKKSVTITYNQNRYEQWFKRNKGGGNRHYLISLHFWCLNPAVAFSQLTNAQTIILTSGTLSPMVTFASELGVSFEVQFEANHVISETQTIVQAISKGPNEYVLNGTFQNTNSFMFQDEVGEVVLKICETIPYGVLCFFTSYSMMDKLMTRWQSTGLYDRLLNKKHIVCEPRASDKYSNKNFEMVLSTFYRTIKESVNRTSIDEQDGAIFFAVCRGKVSEGLDFADNNARAVITVGIPYPNYTDKQVILKKEYNNEQYRSRNLLSGNDWYNIQAYRAINQALGRCIRHKTDWGALILVDNRFHKGSKSTNGLSKWVRSRLQYPQSFSDASYTLKQFVDIQKARIESETSIVQDVVSPVTNTQMTGTQSETSIVQDVVSPVTPVSPVSNIIVIPESPEYSQSSTSQVTAPCSPISDSISQVSSPCSHSTPQVTSPCSHSTPQVSSPCSHSTLQDTPPLSPHAPLTLANCQTPTYLIGLQHQTPSCKRLLNVANAQYDIGDCLNESLTSDTCEEDHQPLLQSITTPCKSHSDIPSNDCNTGPVLRRSKRNVRITNNNDNTPEKQSKKRLLQDSNESIITDTCKCKVSLKDIKGIKIDSYSSIMADDNRDSILFKVLKLKTINDNCYYTSNEVAYDHHINVVSSSSLLNAVWDNVLGICYSMWTCGCGQLIGVKVHCSVTPDNKLIDMTIMHYVL